MFDRFGFDGPGDADDYETVRERMIRTVASRVDDDRVLEALESVPRHEFVPPDRRGDAYADRPLPIGEGQTISAPHMVAIMADELELEEGESVLEIGTGCGYHAAVTAEFVGAENVYSVEYGEELAEKARERLKKTGYGDVSVRVGDGREGWADHAPYDAAYFTCATPELPGPVVEQLQTGGRLLAPVGTAFQTLVKATKRADGSLERTEHCGVRFVRMRG
ncbi:protein-L-isoaspartate(D-aspartate) O-methyltransferase [Natronobacterium gregoryi]|uniref:Protein-L-isoaspartate O-methyltransferase n=2 Tax=Natronobacterium gregoryi TaxID=44930 RepID=L0AG10_NATGS|nr:protein-L-isoaspartate(D-aspartate) O-methyltransferase [Natronobacterium gregoryi]AFZ72858.1 protein-L-isoaspartate and D-aspartate O-methyltransferase [Natronobacterium gregoryi SP2]ELY69652.1 protein-L-isoaspartate O-methyltransferase [Natronobacterium gregoryi SP2]PLK21913.1 protein-L-isoaspartate(D-aspartate) O-methyltransferase [Natronobacterium gregoryi SP2]SFI65882.1 protein-L-isoaspartate(D-aspartate) O-methyltransferase [Natronobacterium gregoryi]